GARWTGETDVHQRLPARPVVAFRPEKTDAVMGVETPPDEQHAILRRLGFEVDGERVVVPTWRARDVTREVDLIEEVARFRLDDGNEGVALFELAHVYLPTGAQLPEERWHVGGIAEGGFAQAKGAVEGLYDALAVEVVFEPVDDLRGRGRGAQTQDGWVLALR